MPLSFVRTATWHLYIRLSFRTVIATDGRQSNKLRATARLDMYSRMPSVGTPPCDTFH